MGIFSNPYKKARKTYQSGADQVQQQYDQAEQSYQPFIDQGQQAYGGYSQMMQNLMNPTKLQDEWMNAYQQSDQAKIAARDAQTAGLDSASSMGLMGSTPAIQAMQAGTASILADDKQRYLDQLMQKYTAGASIAGNIYNTGANMAGQQGQMRGQRAGMTNQQNQDLANLQYNQSAYGGKMMGNILGSGLSAALSAYGISKMPSWGQYGKGTA